MNRRSFLIGSAFAAAALSSPVSLLGSAEDDLLKKMKWLNDPFSWKVADGTVRITCRPKSDFWRKTMIGGDVHENGNLLYVDVASGCTFEARMDARYKHNADHAGLMIRSDAENWLKCCTEQVGDGIWVSIGYARQVSTWSGVEGLKTGPVWLRIVRKNETVESLYSLDGDKYHSVSLVYLPPEKSVAVGLVCCSPEGDGFDSEFSHVKLTVVRPA